MIQTKQSERRARSARTVHVRGQRWLRAEIGKVKVRAIDPPVLVNGTLHALSALDEEFAAQRVAHVAAQRRPLTLWMARAEDVTPPPTRLAGDRVA